jgi:hypothetical protein
LSELGERAIGAATPTTLFSQVESVVLKLTKLKRLFCIFLGLSLLGCSGPGPEDPDQTREKFELTDQAAWIEVQGPDDPFSPESIPSNCGPGGARVEDTILEIETDICPYVTLSQATLGEIDIGDTVKFNFWHLVLVSDPPSEAHVVVSLGQQSLLDKRIPIPSSEQIYPVVWQAKRMIPKGEAIFLHLHNHGYNSYRLSRIEVIPPN